MALKITIYRIVTTRLNKVYQNRRWCRPGRVDLPLTDLWTIHVPYVPGVLSIIVVRVRFAYEKCIRLLGHQVRILFYCYDNYLVFFQTKKNGSGSLYLEFLKFYWMNILDNFIRLGFHTFCVIRSRTFRGRLTPKVCKLN